MSRSASLHRLPVPFLLVGAVTLLFALWAGLYRAGWPLETLRDHHPLAHGPLLLCGFLGTVIGLEKARGVDRWWAYLAPLAAAAGALSLVLVSSPLLPRVAFTAASGLLIGVLGSLLRRRPGLAEAVMLTGAMAWLAGNGLWLAGRSIPTAAAWWIAFPVLTIVGERLELSRVVPKPTWAPALLLFFLAIYLTGIVWLARDLDSALRLQGLGLLLIASWLLRFDLARRTLRAPGVHRYTAMCLLLGYAWLALGGLVALISGADLQGLRYDAVIHTVAIGFVFGMIFGHAPIIAPMLLGRRLRFDRSFWVPLALLELSLALRVGSDLGDLLDGRAWGALLNVVAVLLFLLTMVRAGVRGGSVAKVSPS